MTDQLILNGAITFIRDGKLLASAGDDRIRFWRIPPHNRVWFWLFGAGGLAFLIYWQRTYFIG